MFETHWKTQIHTERVLFQDPIMLHAIYLRNSVCQGHRATRTYFGVRDTYKFCDTPRFSSAYYSSSTISPSSLPECPAGASFTGAGGGLVLWRRSRGGTGERSRGSTSLLVLCIISHVRIYFYLVAKLRYLTKCSLGEALKWTPSFVNRGQEDERRNCSSGAAKYTVALPFIQVTKPL